MSWFSNLFSNDFISNLLPTAIDFYKMQKEFEFQKELYEEQKELLEKQQKQAQQQSPTPYYYPPMQAGILGAGGINLTTIEIMIGVMVLGLGMFLLFSKRKEG